MPSCSNSFNCVVSTFCEISGIAFVNNENRLSPWLMCHKILSFHFPPIKSFANNNAHEYSFFIFCLFYNKGLVIMIRHTSPNGEIGRRSGFKIRRVKPCEFESRPGDQMLIPSRFFCGSGFFYISRIWIRASFTGVPMSSAVCGLGEYAQESFFC